MSLQILVKIRHGGSFPMGWVEDYVGGRFDVRFIDKEDLSIERLMDEISAIGYNNVNGLFYCVPGVGVANGGLRSLSDECSFIEMLEHAERMKAIEIYVEHGIDQPAEVIMEDCDVLLLEGVQEDMQMPKATTPKKKVTVAGPRRSTPRRSTPRRATASANEKVTVAGPRRSTPRRSTPRRATASANEKRTPKKATCKRKVTYPSTSRKKLTPRRATKLSTSSETLPQQEALFSASLDDQCSAQQQASPSSDSDDSVEDENYRMDPREAFADDDFDEDELFVEFSNNGKGKKRRMCKRKRMTVNVEGNDSVPEPNNEPREPVNVEGNESVLEPGQEDREAVNEVHGAHSDDSFQAAICSEDEELNEIRQCNKENLSQEMGHIALNSGAKLGDGVDAGNSFQFNTVRPPRVHSRADNTVDEPGPSTTEPQQQSWPEFFTNYDGGYESDPRSSGDEGPIMASDEDETLVQSLQKRAAKVKYPFFNEEVDMKNVKLTVGLKFTSREILKEAILNYSIQQHYDIVYGKNDKRQLNVNCALCHWQLNATPCRDDASAWKISSMHPYHTCVRTFKNRLITEGWLAGKFIDNFLRDPKFKPRDMKAEMQKQYEIIVEERKCRRAKSRALNAVDGLFKKQYGLLNPYMRELLRSNHGSTCILKVTDQSDSSESGVFQRFYVCFAGKVQVFVRKF